MRIKTIATLAFSLALSAMILGGCAQTTSQDASAQNTDNTSDTSAASPIEVNIDVLKGPTAMGMVAFMNKVDNGEATENDYTFQIAASADEVVPRLTQGETDIAAVPANLASVLYNNTDGSIQALAINTLGVLYICDTGDTVNNVADLAGKTIYASGKGATPEYALSYVLESNGLTPDEDVFIEWKSEHAECVTALLQDPDGIALLPQPFVTTAQAKNDNIRVALDLNEEWESLQEGSTNQSALITGVVVARTQFIEEHPDAVVAFLERYRDSVEAVNGDVDTAAELIGAYDIIPAQVAKTALPACNIVFIDGTEMQEKLSGYLQVLYDQNPQSVGGTVPDESFYFLG